MRLEKNVERAKRIARMLTTTEPYGESMEDGDTAAAITDALADLIHFADAWDLDFDALLSRARQHHLAETAPWDEL